MTRGARVLLQWTTTHPSGVLIFRTDEVTILEADGQHVTFEFIDGYAALTIRRSNVLDYQPVEANR